jgi:hypothetical protein
MKSRDSSDPRLCGFLFLALLWHWYGPDIFTGFPDFGLLFTMNPVFSLLFTGSPLAGRVEIGGSSPQRRGRTEAVGPTGPQESLASSLRENISSIARAHRTSHSPQREL